MFLRTRAARQFHEFIGPIIAENKAMTISGKMIYAVTELNWRPNKIKAPFGDYLNHYFQELQL